jgi:serine protease Do
VDGSAASVAGIAAGDVITSIDGQQVRSTADLSQAMASLTPGQHVSVTWVDGTGQTQQNDVTMGAGPAR